MCYVCVFLPAGVASGVFWPMSAAGRGSQRGVRQTEPRWDSFDPHQSAGLLLHRSGVSGRHCECARGRLYSSVVLYIKPG